MYWKEEKDFRSLWPCIMERTVKRDKPCLLSNIGLIASCWFISLHPTKENTFFWTIFNDIFTNSTLQVILNTVIFTPRIEKNIFEYLFKLYYPLFVPPSNYVHFSYKTGHFIFTLYIHIVLRQWHVHKRHLSNTSNFNFP